VAGVEAISAVAALNLSYSTLKHFRSSSAYLLGVPVGFAFLTVAYSLRVIASSIQSPASFGILIGVVSLLTLMYGLLFLALTYARRTRLRLIGESLPLELGLAAVITALLVAWVLLVEPSGSARIVPIAFEISAIAITALAVLYIIYETLRSWRLTRRASEGVVSVGLALFFAGHVGFMLGLLNLGDFAIFVAYEGQLLGLFVLNAVTSVGIRKGDSSIVVRRLGLAAPAHGEV
jgi:hypothetical protein